MELNDFYKEANQMSRGHMIALFTDKIELTSWPEGKNVLDVAAERLLEARVFDEDREIKLFRGSIGSAFKMRIRDDKKDAMQDYFDEMQYLDIDIKRSKASFDVDKTVYTTGGGRYTLPIGDHVGDYKVNIRYYLSRYEDSGQARVCDWRVVKWFEEYTGGERDGKN